MNEKNNKSDSAYQVSEGQSQDSAKLGAVTMAYNRDAESGTIDALPTNQWGDMSGLSEKVIRIRFIRKVYMILSAQLIFTFGIVAIFVFVKPINEWAQTDAGFIGYIISYVIFFGLIVTISIMNCMRSTFLKRVPGNYMLLIGLTLSLTYMLAMISAYNSVEAVLIAIGVTMTVTIGVSLFAMQTKYDFTNCWLLMLCLSLALFGFGISLIIVSQFADISIMQSVYGGLGALLMAMFLAIDTQMLMGNKKYAFDPEDYINASVNLYLDIVNMFLYLLAAFGKK